LPHLLVVDKYRLWNEAGISLRKFFYFFAVPSFVGLGREYRDGQYPMIGIDGPQEMSPGVGPQFAVCDGGHDDGKRISGEMENRGFVSGKQPA